MSVSPDRATREVPVSDQDLGILLEDLFRVEAPRLRRFFRRRMRADEDARDFVQEAFTRFASVAAKTLPAQPAAYLQRIARNLLIDRARRPPVPSELEAVVVGTRPEQEDAMLAGDLMAIYEETLAALPVRTSTIFRLHRVEGLRYREIAAQLDISIPAVQKHMARALEQLAWALQGGE